MTYNFMTDAGAALKELGVTDWVLHGIPTSETEFNAMFRKVTGTDEYGIAIEDSDPSNFGITWAQVSAKMDELVAAEPLRLLREERNYLLAETDWWVLPDRTATQAQLDYRQALRDITDTYTSLDNVVWPTKP